MTQGEPFEESETPQARDGENADAVIRAPRRGDADAGAEAPKADDAELDALDADVQNLLYELASEEHERDADWVEASRDGTDSPPAPAEPPEAEAEAEAPPPPPPPAAQAPSPNLGLEAINALGDKIEASEARHTEAMGKMGHALGVIAKRIDGIETRITDRAITEVAMTAAPPEEEDPTVAPYIARAERELKTAPRVQTDIFDRIAKATESQMDDRPGPGTAKRLSNANTGRRVGTKRWQPSSTVKRRMQQLEESAAPATAPDDAVRDDAVRDEAVRDEAVGDDAALAPPPPAEEPRPAATTAPEPAPEVEPAPAPEPEARPAPAAKAKPAAKSRKATPPPSPDPVFEPDDEDEDDSGLSIVPGARGRRRNRARKSHQDADFEDIFVEEDGKPSLQSLRRKMRERPVADALTDPAPKSGFLGGILGRKQADAAEADDDDLDEADFHDELDDAPVTKSRKPARTEVDDADAFDDEDAPAKRGIGKPVLYALIALAAAAGFFAFRAVMG